LFFLYGFYNEFYRKTKLKILEREAIIICIKLEKLIRVVSQAQEHVIRDIVSKTKIDLLLVDAESALKNYQATKKKLTKWTWF